MENACASDGDSPGTGGRAVAAARGSARLVSGCRRWRERVAPARRMGVDHVLVAADDASDLAPMPLAAVGVAPSSLGSAVAFAASGAAVVSIATFVCMVGPEPPERRRR